MPGASEHPSAWSPSTTPRPPNRGWTGTPPPRSAAPLRPAGPRDRSRSRTSGRARRAVSRAQPSSLSGLTVDGPDSITASAVEPGSHFSSADARRRPSRHPPSAITSAKPYGDSFTRSYTSPTRSERPQVTASSLITCLAAGAVGLLTLGGKPAREPVLLARDVVVHLAEAKRLEPARGSWAEVSYRVPAVHDHGLVAVQPRDRVRVQLLQREADRSREVLLLVLLAREHLDAAARPRRRVASRAGT